MCIYIVYHISKKQQTLTTFGLSFSASIADVSCIWIHHTTRSSYIIYTFNGRFYSGIRKISLTKKTIVIVVYVYYKHIWYRGGHDEIFHFVVTFLSSLPISLVYTNKCHVAYMLCLSIMMIGVIAINSTEQQLVMFIRFYLYLCILYTYLGVCIIWCTSHFQILFSQTFNAIWQVSPNYVPIIAEKY